VEHKKSDDKATAEPAEHHQDQHPAVNEHDIEAKEHEQVAAPQPHQLSLLAGLEEGKLPYTTEVHLVEVVNGVKKTYLASWAMSGNLLNYSLPAPWYT